MTTRVEPWREQLARALDWEEAHIGFSKAVDGIPPNKRGASAPGFEHSPWQLVEHLRIALEDLVDFAVNPRYTHSRNWPADYWPANPTPSDDEWTECVSAYRGALARLQSIARDASIDLTAAVPTGTAAQTYLRTLLLAVDHNAYHIGQIVAVRRALGIWL